MKILKLGLILGGSNAPSGSTDLNFTFSVNTATTGSTTSTQFQMPFKNIGFTTVDVDWGDGNTDTITTWNQAETLHTYSSSGIYTIKIANVVNGFAFNNGGDKAKINIVSNCGQLNINTLGAFFGCLNMTWTATDSPTIGTTDLGSTFRGCTAFNGNINNWDVSSVTNLFAFMYEANSFTGALDGWDIGSVTSIGYFANGATITTDNYDALLVSWEGQSPFVGLTNVNFGNSTFSLGTAADTARASLVSTYNWTITDGGGI
tara:strand:- start:282 stop:1064 length:783 start_codon:yes stop_codon:yes gene_type:complete